MPARSFEVATLLRAIAAIIGSLAPSLASAQAPAPTPPAQANAHIGAAQPNRSYAQVIEIRVVGNRRIPRDLIVSKLRTKVERSYVPQTLEKDMRALVAWGRFSEVEISPESTDEGGVIVTVEVVERPVMLKSVRFIGNQKISRSILAMNLDLKLGSPVESGAVEEGKCKLEEYYHSQGIDDVQITILEGTLPGDDCAVYRIHEGPPPHLDVRIEFKSANIVVDGRSIAQNQDSPPPPALTEGQVDRRTIEENKQRLFDCYHGYGFLRAKVSVEADWNSAGDRLTTIYIVDEGPHSSESRP